MFFLPFQSTKYLIIDFFAVFVYFIAQVHSKELATQNIRTKLSFVQLNVFFEQRAKVHYLVTVKRIEESWALLKLLTFQKMNYISYSSNEAESNVNFNFVGHQKLSHLNEREYEFLWIFH